ncbi:MAG: PilZ domain-containing protein [Nitrospira sp.]|nr:PilZ domain-containing protein [Nitrospira sp.]
MSRTIAVACRVDFRAAHSGTLKEQVGRVELLSASGCTILSHPQPAPETLFELRIALPDGHWPLIVERAQVIESQWDAFTVEFLSVPLRDQQRLRNFLAKPVTRVGPPHRLIFAGIIGDMRR